MTQIMEVRNSRIEHLRYKIASREVSSKGEGEKIKIKYAFQKDRPNRNSKDTNPTPRNAIPPTCQITATHASFCIVSIPSSPVSEELRKENKNRGYEKNSPEKNK